MTTMLKNSFTLKTGTLEELNSIITQPDFKGTISNLPSWMYHQCAGVSRSTLTELDKSLSHYIEKKKNPRKATKDMNFGSGFHDYLMLPDEFAQNFAIEPDKKAIPDLLETVDDLKAALTELGLPTNGRKKDDHIKTLLAGNPSAQIWDVIQSKFEAECQGKIILTNEEFSRIKLMVKSVNNHPTLNALRSHEVIFEQSFFWRDPESGLLCKCRPDVIFITPNLFLPGDWKTTETASFESFQRTIGKFGYHIQAPYYLDGINLVLEMAVENFMFIPVEKEAPHELSLFAIDAAAQEVGRNKYKKHLQTLAAFEANLTPWLGYPKEIQNISVPSYMFYQEA